MGRRAQKQRGGHQRGRAAAVGAILTEVRRRGIEECVLERARGRGGGREGEGGGGSVRAPPWMRLLLSHWHARSHGRSNLNQILRSSARYPHAHACIINQSTTPSPFLRLLYRNSSAAASGVAADPASRPSRNPHVTSCARVPSFLHLRAQAAQGNQELCVQ